MSTPDVDYCTPINGRAHVRVEIGKTRGDVDWFLVQLEYNMSPSPVLSDDWRQVARFDHHPNETYGHDIRIERLHLDIMKHGRKDEVERGFPPVAVNDAPAICEEYLVDHAAYYLSEFKAAHNTGERTV